MAGIVATSATTNNSSSTAVDASVSGYLTGEEVTLTSSPSGSSYSWSLSVPSGSTRARLSSTTSAAPKLTPDIPGYYVITVVVDGTTYVLRLAAVSVGTVATLGVIRLLPMTDGQAPTPSSGANLFYSSTQGGLAVKLTNGSVITVDTTAV